MEHIKDTKEVFQVLNEAAPESLALGVYVEVVVRFSHCSLFGVCFWCFRFARCGASGHVGASALSLCCVLACVSLLLLPRLGKRVVICT